MDYESLPVAAIECASMAAAEKHGMGALHVGSHVLLALINEGHVSLTAKAEVYLHSLNMAKRPGHISARCACREWGHEQYSDSEDVVVAEYERHLLERGIPREFFERFR